MIFPLYFPSKCTLWDFILMMYKVITCINVESIIGQNRLCSSKNFLGWLGSLKSCKLWKVKWISHCMYLNFKVGKKVKF